MPPVLSLPGPQTPGQTPGLRQNQQFTDKVRDDDYREGKLTDSLGKALQQTQYVN